MYALITHIANKQSDLSISSSEPSNPSVRSSETLPPFETLSLSPGLPLLRITSYRPRLSLSHVLESIKSRPFSVKEENVFTSTTNNDALDNSSQTPTRTRTISISVSISISIQIPTTPTRCSSTGRQRLCYRRARAVGKSKRFGMSLLLPQPFLINRPSSLLTVSLFPSRRESISTYSERSQGHSHPSQATTTTSSRKRSQTTTSTKSNGASSERNPRR